jgi:hypothetical protein
MNPLLSIFLLGMSLLAIATAFALLFYIYVEVKRNREALEAEKLQEAALESEARQVSTLLMKMQESTIPSGSRTQQ